MKNKQQAVNVDAVAETRPVPERFRSFSWKDLNLWTDNGSVKRGRGYVGRVSNVAITKDDHVIATVSGGDDYSTEIWFGDIGLEGHCTCPVGHRCKHTVALVLKSIDLLAANATLPIADDDDYRLDDLKELGEWDEFGDNDGAGFKRQGGEAKESPTPKTADELDAHIDALDEASAKHMIREILNANHDIRADWLRRVKTERSDVAQLLKMARRELKRLAREEAWVNPWKHEYHIPDYAPLRRILEQLLAKKAFNELVAFGDSLKTETREQTIAAHDEGDTARQICSCMEIVAEAVGKSSLSTLEQLRWFANLHEDDDYSTFNDICNPFNDPGEWKASDWSALADEMLTIGDEVDDKDNADVFVSDYHAEESMRRICKAFENAGRTDEAKSYRINWLRSHGEYADLAQYHLKNGETDAAWAAAMEGFTSKNARDKYGHLKEHLRRILREIAIKRGDARLALAIQVEDFFANPSDEDFFSVLEAAKAEGIDANMRPWLIRFLETGIRPDEPLPNATDRKSTRKRGSHAKSAIQVKPAATHATPAPSEPWPLAPSGIPPRTVEKFAEKGADILMHIALAEKDADETLRRWLRIKPRMEPPNFYDGWYPYPYIASEVADALAETYPEESLSIWDKSIERNLKLPATHAYDEIAQTFRKSRPVMARLGRLHEWENRIRSLQNEYRRRKNFVQALNDVLEPMSAASRPIIETRPGAAW